MIIDLQRRLAECGRIRIGMQVPVGTSGKTRPSKLETFRLTSPDRTRIEHAAALWGGTVRPWEAPAGQQWEVVTTSTTLEVIVPPSDMSFSQSYELWNAGGCVRRCNGRLEQLTEGACLCDPAARDCDIHTRLSVLLRDLPGLGVWRIDTSGYYAAVELQGAVQVIALAAGRGQMLPARLRLEQRTVKRPGLDGKPVTRRFAVPVLDIDASPGQLMLGGTAPVYPEPVAAPEPQRPMLTPVPAAAPGGRSVAQQMTAAEQPTPAPRRANAATPIPSTGLAPRTAAQAAEHTPPVPGITGQQIKLMGALMGQAGLSQRESAIGYVTALIGRQVTSRNQLSVAEASEVIDALQDDLNGADATPPPAPEQLDEDAAANGSAAP